MPSLKQQAKKMRKVMRKQVEQELLNNPEEVKKAIESTVKTRTSCKYHMISRKLGVNIIWGEGGTQDRRKSIYDAMGIKYIEID